jgi:HSP20 family protein
MNITRRPTQTPTTAQPTSGEWDPFRMMRDLMRWDPFRELSPIFPADGQKGLFVPDVDVKETADAYVFKADLPGMKEKDVEVSLTNNRLTLRGKREEEKREEKDNYFTCERSWGSFSRSFTLPQGTSVESAHADLKDGVLTVTVPKKAEAQPKKIPIGAAPEKKEPAKA